MKLEVKRDLFISWAYQTTRAENISRLIEFRNVQVAPFFKKKWLKPLNYVCAAVVTLCILLLNRPCILIVSTPPSLLLYIGLAYGKLFGAHVVADCHNGTFKFPWSKTPLLTPTLEGFGEVWVHNKNIFEKTRIIRGGAISHVLVDPLLFATNLSISRTCLEKQVLVPSSFSVDEPLEEVLKCAELNPDWKFLITGNSNRRTLKFGTIPRNVILTGFISKDEYFSIMLEASVIFCLTTDEDTQLCSAAEAVGLKKKVICSNTPTLLEQYDNAVIFSENDALSLSDSLRSALDFDVDFESFFEEYNKKWSESFLRTTVGKMIANRSA